MEELMENTLTLEEVTNIILSSSKTIQEGGIPEWEWNETYIPWLELIQQALSIQGIDIVFKKVER